MSFSNRPPIITIGSGNIEYILEHDGEIELGKKHLIKIHELIGGSCANYSLRLISTGNNVYPIPFIGKDPDGNIVRDEIIKKGLESGLSEDALKFIGSEDFFIPGIRTPKATVVVHMGRRTIFSQTSAGSKLADDHLEKRIEQLNKIITTSYGSVMIGHIFFDGDPENPGGITKKIINTYNQNFLVFANFGNSQLKQGIDFWKDDLTKIDLLQLNLEEIRKLFKAGDRNKSLYEIVEWLRGHSITAVISLNRFGAIGTFKNGKDGIILAWPLDIDTIVDPTGAGDAFASGMVSRLGGKKDFTFQEFLSAIVEGRLWASYACTTIGASGNCPTRKILDSYLQKHSKLSHELLEIKETIYAEQIIHLIDKAY